MKLRNGVPSPRSAHHATRRLPWRLRRGSKPSGGAREPVCDRRRWPTVRSTSWRPRCWSGAPASCNFLGLLLKGKQVKRYLAALGAMQDTLGTINDLAVAKTLLSTLRAEARGAFGSAFTLLDAALAARLVDKLANLPAAWHELKKTRPFWS